jgi:hypothetical protein
MFRVGDRLSLVILGLACGGTFIGLALTSIAKRNGQTGPPPKPDFPWLQSGEAAQFEARLSSLSSSLPGGGDGGTGSGGGGGGESGGGSKSAG